MAHLLEANQIQEKVQSKNSLVDREIDNSINHDYRAQFHSEPHQKESDIPYIKSFLGWIKAIIDDNKFEVFKHLLQFPIETVDFTEGIFNELQKIFHAEDRFIKHQFTNPETEADFKKYLHDIGDNDFWQSEGFDAMKTAISSIMVVDMPRSEGGVEIPEPYYYLLPIANLIDIHVDRQRNIDWLIFRDINNDKIIHAFDSQFYRSYNKVDDRIVLIAEVPHELGYCPARSFWTTRFNTRSKIQKRSPISNTLGRLDKLLAKNVFCMHETLYAGFPVDIMYEQECGFQDELGNACESGYVSRQVRNPEVSAGSDGDYILAKEPCPECNSNKPMLGAGTVLTAPARGDKDDPDLIHGLNRVSADVQSLEWLEKSIEKDEKSITWNMIGYLNEQSKEAMNEMQVAGNYESRLNVLLDTKENFEKIHTFTINTLGKLRYNAAYTGSIINYGEKFHLHSVIKLQEGLKLSKEAGMPIFEVSNQQQQIMNTKYQNNPEMLTRVRVLSSLEPFQTYTTDDILNMNDKFPLDPIKVAIKINFEDFINRFEREQMDVVPFMQFSEFQTKINFIQTKLDDYGNEFIANSANAQNDSQPNEGVSPRPAAGGGQNNAS